MNTQVHRADDVLADPAVDAFAEEVIAAGTAVRLPVLLCVPRPGALYVLSDRNGISDGHPGTAGHRDRP